MKTAIGYRIVRRPAVGDVVLDVLTIQQYSQDKIQVDSDAAFGEKQLALSASANWGDQYEQGAEIELRDAILSIAFYDYRDSPHYNVANAEGSPLAWLRWSLVEGESPSIYGQFWPAVTPAAKEV